MKDLTLKEWESAPHIVQLVRMYGLAKMPVSSSTLNKAMKEFPEYFQEEIERQKRWDAIPQYVHDYYHYEEGLIRKEIYKDMPQSIGILGWATDTKAWAEYMEAHEKCTKIFEPLIKALHDKVYFKYGIPNPYSSTTK